MLHRQTERSLCFRRKEIVDRRKGVELVKERKAVIDHALCYIAAEQVEIAGGFIMPPVVPSLATGSASRQPTFRHDLTESNVDDRIHTPHRCFRVFAPRSLAGEGNKYAKVEREASPVPDIPPA